MKQNISKEARSHYETPEDDLNYRIGIDPRRPYTEDGLRGMYELAQMQLKYWHNESNRIGDLLLEFENNPLHKCVKCRAVNHKDYLNCWLCGNNIYKSKKTFVVNYRGRKGGYVMTESEQRFATDFRNTHQKEMLQPTRYNNVTKKIEKNPDFVKLYGDPEKKHNVGGNLNVRERNEN